ncbi:MAG: hypothetical protein HS104_09670 [Polyangiaceae bacterium]|nr:hypothetical protein [Polyangiaceae bacterium]MCL4754355.1 hypothetical protein [Myxococcales bacterium]
MSGRGLKLRELPGWNESLAEVNRTLRWPLDGTDVKVLGAFVAPSSVTAVTPWLLYNFAVGVGMHRWQKRVQVERAERAERAGNVISLAERRADRYLESVSPLLRGLQAARAEFPFRPPGERAGGYGADGKQYAPESPPWAPSSHEGDGAS